MVEQQFLLGEIKRISLGDDIETVEECPECLTENTIKTKLDVCMVYKKNELPSKYNDEIELVDIPNKEFLNKTIQDIKESDDYDGITTDADIESALHFKIQGKNTKQVIDYLDNLPLKDVENLISALEAKLPNTEFKYKKTCKGCNKKVEFNVDITQGIFETLAK